ncbi:hypothetical protein [Thalassospira sp. UBA1131]|uniref:tellurite resistance TerB family protein n=1 Tax=Thalassospira sp. UBA1131 TaxID=1947672 RepID=UPI0026011E72|nr:hypothetical protein [Thalassospira sp. UBA1131]
MPVNKIFHAKNAPPIPGTWPPIHDEPEEAITFAPASNPDAELDIGDISFAIEYCDSRNRITMRRITVHRCDTEPTAYRIHAHCHERKKYRSFLSTGILSVIDVDGVTYHPVAFFRNELSTDVDPNRFPPSDFTPGAEKRAPAGQFAKQKFRHQMRLLSTLSRSDGFMHPAELDFMLDHVAKGCIDLGRPMMDADTAAITAYLKRLHPTESQINDAFDAIWDLDLQQRRQFLDACHELIKADGVLKPEELELFQSFEDEFG